ncbi:hypothetical protein RJ639_023036 [Escallonia herrerae]|uniref:O-fucosyltransferase family protein n=1 Tax=Escallonia herrerae TaxID=1293975 RepID=A0AA89AE06_9ASTE|nr:hypothetical protein RJ639_023036 [Escallonia herrerae]
MVFKSKLKWVGLVGLVLSAFSLFTHFLLARYTDGGFSEYPSAITIFSWRPVFEDVHLSIANPLYRRLWGPVRRLESLHPLANPRGGYAAIVYLQGPVLHRSRSMLVEVILEPSRASKVLEFVCCKVEPMHLKICDAVVIARLLNATLVIPEIQSTTSSKGISSEFKSFAYLYNEDQFMAALSKDVMAAIAILPPHLEAYQRLRCRIAFHALRFRQEVQELATRTLNRLRTPGRPFIAYDPGMTRGALAYYGCAELFQDVHTELIQHRRSWMIKRGIVKGNLTVDSAEQRRNGSCPLMPEEVGILLRAYGYSWDTVIYVSGGEVFGGQKKLIPLHAMFENVVDRTSLTTAWELNNIYGSETSLIDTYSRDTPSDKEEMKLEAWKAVGPRPRWLPLPPARPKYYNSEGWWGWVAESDNEPESKVMELRTTAHKLLWEAIDYAICLGADVFVPGFDRDGKGRPSFASLVMGHRLYQSTAAKTYRLDRKQPSISAVPDSVLSTDCMLQMIVAAGEEVWTGKAQEWKEVNEILELIKDEEHGSIFLCSSLGRRQSPECSCLRSESTGKSVDGSSPSAHLHLPAALGVTHPCPAWMDNDVTSHLRGKENEEDLDEDDSISSGLFFEHINGNHEDGGAELSSKDDGQMEDQEELEHGDR